MLRPESSLRSNANDGSAQSQSETLSAPGGVDIQQELNKLEELILSNPRVPFTSRTLVDEDQLLDQLDLIRLNLPPAFQEATRILQQRESILAEAQRYANDLVTAADQEAAARLDELGIVRQAEQLAQQIKGQTQQECDQVRSQTLAEVDQMRLQAQREWESTRQQAFNEKNAIESEANSYADNVLLALEQQLTSMLNTIQNGRSRLQQSIAEPPTPTHRSSAPRENRSGPRSERPQR